MKQQETQQSLHFRLFLHPGGEPGLGRLMWKARQAAVAGGGGGRGGVREEERAVCVRRVLSGCVSAAQRGKETGVDSQPLIRWRISADVSRPPVPAPGGSTRSHESFRTQRCDVHTPERAQRQRKHRLGGSAVTRLLSRLVLCCTSSWFQWAQLVPEVCLVVFVQQCNSWSWSYVFCAACLWPLRCCCSSQGNSWSCDGLKVKRLWLVLRCQSLCHNTQSWTQNFCLSDIFETLSNCCALGHK